MYSDVIHSEMQSFKLMLHETTKEGNFFLLEFSSFVVTSQFKMNHFSILLNQVMDKYTASVCNDQTELFLM